MMANKRHYSDIRGLSLDLKHTEAIRLNQHRCANKLLRSQDMVIFVLTTMMTRLITLPPYACVRDYKI